MTRRVVIQRTGLYLVLAFFLLVFLIPMFWMLSSSFKSLANTLTVEIHWLPEKLHFSNYTTIWGADNFELFFANSIYVAAVVTTSTLFFAAMTGYGLAKFEFPGKGLIFTFIMATMMVPFQVILIPLYLVVRDLHWVNTYRGMIIPGALSAFGVFLMRQYILSISDEFIDAARIDGAREFSIFLRIILPLSKPALTSLGILTFLGSWNNLLWPLIVVNSNHLQTLPLGLTSIMLSQYGVRYNILMSGAVIAAVPTVVVFLIFQRGFVKGIAMGGLKG